MVRRVSLLSTALCAMLMFCAIDATPVSATARLAISVSAPSLLQLAAYDPLVYRAQVALTRRGFDVGAPDGELGPRTRAAIEAFQRATGIAVTGRLNDGLVAQLEQNRAPRTERAVERRRPIPMSESELTSLTQMELKRQGYDVTVIGGRLNGETRDAISDFQRRHDLAATGTPSQDLLARLRTSDDRVGILTEPASGNVGAPSERGELPPPGTADNGPRYVTLLSDEFNDTGIADSPDWRVLAGNWSVGSGVLTSNVPIPRTRPLYAPVVSRAEQPLGIAPQDPTGLAAIVTARQIENAFRISTTLGGRGQAPATINIGPYQGVDAGSGYRLIYDGESGQPFKLLAARPGFVQTIATAASPMDLFDGRMHVLEWTRDFSGRMEVSVDGVQTLALNDQAISGPFDGYSIINTGGSWGVSAVTLQNLDVSDGATGAGRAPSASGLLSGR